MAIHLADRILGAVIIQVMTDIPAELIKLAAEGKTVGEVPESYFRWRQEVFNRNKCLFDCWVEDINFDDTAAFSIGGKRLLSEATLKMRITYVNRADWYPEDMSAIMNSYTAAMVRSVMNHPQLGVTDNTISWCRPVRATISNSTIEEEGLTHWMNQAELECLVSLSEINI